MDLILNTALSQYGVSEIKGKPHNQIIINYFKEIGYQWVSTDETAWCSAFINWCCLKNNLPKSGKLSARSWLRVGKKIEDPKLGDIVIFWRESRTSWKGHVALYINETETHINVLGGNQSNKVCIKPYTKERLLSYRRIESS